MRDPKFFEERRKHFDPDEKPVQLHLGMLHSLTFAASKAINGFSAWMYDPRNRINSPWIAICPDLACALADMAEFMTDSSPDDPAIEQALRKALLIVEIKKFEFKAKALKDGGYITADPSEEVYRSGDRRLGIDQVRAETFRLAAETKKAQLEKT